MSIVKKIHMSSLPAGLFLLLMLVLPTEGLSTFEDNFDGTEIDSTKWNTDIATTGKRWCSTTVQSHQSNPGNWQDVEIESCHGVIQMSPYGAITVSDGQAIFSSGWIRAFPYIWSGPPSRLSPFPSTGDFILEVRMKYDSIQGHGDGFDALFWQNTDPVGDNPPIPAGQDVFGIWADIRGVRTTTVGGQVFVSEPFSFHDYRLEYIGGEYSLFVDGMLEVGPTDSSLRPNTIWIGNPVFTHWGIIDWTDFTIDFVRVTIPHIEVPVDIKPRSCPNPLNVKSKGVLPLAILGTEDFDVTTIDPASIRLAGVSPIRSRVEDVSTPVIDKQDECDCTTEGEDGFDDLTLKFDTQEIVNALGEVADADELVLTLTGELLDGTSIEGEDCIVVLSKGGKGKK